MEPQTAGTLTKESEIIMKPLHIDETYLRKLESELINTEKQYTFKPLWNPHTQDTGAMMTQRPLQSSKPRWRKTRKNK